MLLHMQALQGPARDNIFSGRTPGPGEVVPVTKWTATMHTTTGVIIMKDSEVYCSSRADIADMTSTEFAAALSKARADGQPETVIPVRGELHSHSHCCFCPSVIQSGLCCSHKRHRFCSAHDGLLEPHCYAWMGAAHRSACGTAACCQAEGMSGMQAC